MLKLYSVEAGIKELARHNALVDRS
jgi:hypothetical protein